MKLSQLAKIFATKKHKGKWRRFEGGPYISHPIAVAKYLEKMVRDENVIASAYLHDILEDTDTSPEEIKEEFGSDVLEIVEQLTAPDGYNGKKKTQFWQDRTMEMSDDALLIKLVDRLHNTRSIVATLKKVLSFKEFTIRQTKELINNLIRNKKEFTREQELTMLEFVTASGLKWNRNGLLVEGDV